MNSNNIHPIHIDLSAPSPITITELGAVNEMVRVPVSITSSINTYNIDGYVADTATWNSKTSLIAEKNAVYIYTDHFVDSLGNKIPGFKVGDGVTLLAELSFNDDSIEEKLSIDIIDCGIGAG